MSIKELGGMAVGKVKWFNDSIFNKLLPGMIFVRAANKFTGYSFIQQDIIKRTTGPYPLKRVYTN
jgi:hypothetical protein